MAPKPKGSQKNGKYHYCGFGFDMTSNTKISQRFPSTGASTAEQTAANARKRTRSNHVWQIDKLVYQLVENNVEYAGEQFSENLRFNSKVLTNVLYDNIYKLLGEKFQEDEFIDWLAQQLLDKGAVIQTTSTPPQPAQGAVEEVHV
jgi:hypothetical protein